VLNETDEDLVFTVGLILNPPNKTPITNFKVEVGVIGGGAVQ